MYKTFQKNIIIKKIKKYLKKVFTYINYYDIIYVHKGYAIQNERVRHRSQRVKNYEKHKRKNYHDIR